MVSLRAHLARLSRRLCYRALIAAAALAPALGSWDLTPSCAAAELPPPLVSWLSAQSSARAWSAEFVQQRHLRTLTQPLVATGRVWFAQPGRVRWELGIPAKTIAVRDATRFMVAYPALRRAEVYPASGTGPWKDALALLEGGFVRGAAEFQERFDLLSHGTTNGILSVLVQPHSASARRLMPRFLLEIGGGGADLRATELTLADGTRLRNEFRGGRVLDSVDDSLFAPPFGPDYQVSEPLKK